MHTNNRLEKTKSNYKKQKLLKIIITNHTKSFGLIPDSALLLKNRPFFCPDYVQALHAKIALAVKINRLGKYIQEKFASNYYDEIGFAIHFYDKPCLDSLIQQGLPWEQATCFDSSFALSEFMKISEIGDTMLTLAVAPTKGRPQGSPQRSPQQVFQIESVLSEIPSIISELSTYMTLKIGDYIAIELGEVESAPLAINDCLRVSLNAHEILSVTIK